MVITIKLFYFASIKDLIKKPIDTIKLSQERFENSNLFFSYLASNYKLIEIELIELFKNCILSIDDEYIDRNNVLVLKNGDELSVIPPISAG